MKALILCAGFGSRLGALCVRTPKPLLSLGPFTIVDHIVGQLRTAGIREVFVNLHHQGERIPRALGDGGAYGLKIEYLRESSLLGTAGSARTLRDAIGDGPLLVHYGDIVTNHPLSELNDLHREARSAITALVHPRRDSNSRAWLDASGKITKFEERPQTPLRSDVPSPHAFSGIAVLSAQTVHDLSPRVPLDLPRDVFPAMASAGLLFGQQLSGYRWAIDSPHKLHQARLGFEARTNVQPNVPSPSTSPQ